MDQSILEPETNVFGCRCRNFEFQFRSSALGHCSL